LSFLGLTVFGTLLLLLPFARSGDGSASLPTAIFT
jgi:trk system potassium uptake protein